MIKKILIFVSLPFITTSCVLITDSVLPSVEIEGVCECSCCPSRKQSNHEMSSRHVSEPNQRKNWIVFSNRTSSDHP